MQYACQLWVISIQHTLFGESFLKFFWKVDVISFPSFCIVFFISYFWYMQTGLDALDYWIQPSEQIHLDLFNSLSKKSALLIMLLFLFIMRNAVTNCLTEILDTWANYLNPPSWQRFLEDKDNVKKIYFVITLSQPTAESSSSKRLIY